MPIIFRIDEDRQRIFTRAVGVVTYEEMRAHMNADVGEAAASYGEIFDCSDAVTNITAREIRSLAAERQMVAERRPPGPVAVIATDAHFFGMLRMFDMLTETVRPLMVFRSTAEAEAWLDDTENMNKNSNQTSGFNILEA